MNRAKLKEMQLNATFEASDGSNDKSDLEFIDKEGSRPLIMGLGIYYIIS